MESMKSKDENDVGCIENALLFIENKFDDAMTAWKTKLQNENVSKRSTQNFMPLTEQKFLTKLLIGYYYTDNWALTLHCV